MRETVDHNSLIAVVNKQLDGFLVACRCKRIGNGVAMPIGREINDVVGEFAREQIG